MATIKKLEESVIAKIAAGEAIERPASVVKELVENSIDAGATHVFITLREGGKSYIKIEDNGCGMEPKDAELALERHATSKIENAEDLFHIHTLGFRGEALASIAAVSEMTLLTRTQEGEGFFLEIIGGSVTKKEAQGANRGTTIEVNNLFFNTPARKKYMRSMQQELSVITELIEKFVLIYPTVSFRLEHQENILIHAPASSDPLGSIIAVYGKEVGKEMLAVKEAQNGITVEGFIAKPSQTRSDRGHLSFYINKRHIKSPLLTNAVMDAYRTLLPVQRYPLCVLNITLNPQEVDVNAHPTKQEVRLSHEHQVYEAVFDAVKKVLDSHSLIPVATQKPASFVPYTFTAPKNRPEHLAEERQRYGVVQGTQTMLSSVSPKTEETEKIPGLHILGQVNKTYILAEDKEGIMIIDQHVAHERTLYEQFMDQFMGKSIVTQKLIEPLVLEMTPAEVQVVNSYAQMLLGLGFEMEHFGKNSYIVRTIPVVMGRQLSQDAIWDVLEELKTAGASSTQDTLKEKILTRMSCRAAVKAGDELTLAQMRMLIEGLHTAKRPFTCPHGRPILIQLPLDEIEKRFKRK